MNRTLEIDYLFATIWKKRRAVVVIALSTFCIFVLLALLLPKQYKSTAVINIYNKYFQAGLVRDYAPQTEVSELRGQIESLAKRALSDNFLQATGEKYHIFKSQPQSTQRGTEVEQMAKHFEFFAFNPSTYQLSFISNDPVIARDVTLDALHALEKTLVDERIETIAGMRDAIRKRIESIVLGKSDTVDPLAFERGDLLTTELAKTKAELKALRLRFTDTHPEVARLIARTKRIESLIAAQEGAKPPKATHENTETSPPMIGEESSGSKDPNGEVYQELVKKLNYLNITLDQEAGGQPSYYGIVQNPVVPEAPTWPNKTGFAIWGFLVGLVLSVLYIAGIEYLSKSSADPLEVSRKLKVPLLGTMPSFAWKLGEAVGPKEKGKSEMSGPGGWQ